MPNISHKLKSKLFTKFQKDALEELEALIQMTRALQFNINKESMQGEKCVSEFVASLACQIIKKIKDSKYFSIILPSSGEMIIIFSFYEGECFELIPIKCKKIYAQNSQNEKKNLCSLLRKNESYIYDDDNCLKIKTYCDMVNRMIQFLDIIPLTIEIILEKECVVQKCNTCIKCLKSKPTSKHKVVI